MEDQPGGTSSPVACRYDANAPTTEGTLDEQMEYMAPESQTDQATKARDLGNQGGRAADKARSKGEEVAGQARERGQEAMDQTRIKADQMSHITHDKASKAPQLPPTSSANRVRAKPGICSSVHGGGSVSGGAASIAPSLQYADKSFGLENTVNSGIAVIMGSVTVRVNHAMDRNMPGFSQRMDTGQHTDDDMLDKTRTVWA